MEKEGIKLPNTETNIEEDDEEEEFNDSEDESESLSENSDDIVDRYMKVFDIFKDYVSIENRNIVESI